MNLFVSNKVNVVSVLQPQAACAMPVLGGMKIKTDSEVTKKAR